MPQSQSYFIKKNNSKFMQIRFLLLFCLLIITTHQENQNVIFFQYPMLWTDYVILNTNTYQGNNVYTYNVPVGDIKVTNVTTGVAIAGFTSQATNYFQFRMNEYFQNGTDSFITLNWTVISPSDFSYLSFTVIVLQQDAEYLQIIKYSYVNPSGLYNGTETGSFIDVVPQQTRFSLASGDQIYNFITSIQMLNNKGRYKWYNTCCGCCSCWSCNPYYTWDSMYAYTSSAINDINHIRVQYACSSWTQIFQVYSFYIIFHKNNYNSQHIYPYMIDYKDNLVLSNTYISSNLDFRYGPDYNNKCLFGQNSLVFGRFYPRLNFNITPTGIRSQDWSQQNGQVQTTTDFICVIAFQCDTYTNSTTNTTTNSTTNSTNSTTASSVPSFYFPAYKNCSTCDTKIVGAQSCQDVNYCISCVEGYDVPNNQSCIFCLACDSYAYVLSTGYCQACNITFEGCLKCSTDAYPSCTLCLSDQWYLNSSLCYLCNTTMSLCITCNGSNFCTQCYSPDGTFYLNSSTHKCTLCSTTLANCLNCNNNTDCIFCQSSFYYVDSLDKKCKLCNVSNPFCVTCANESFCLTCEVNYIPDQNGTCQFCDFYTSNCTQCTNDTVCFNCSLSYFLDYQDQCGKCSQFTTGCYLCDNNSTCQDCYEDYVLETDALCYYCALYISECVICKNQTYCTNCSYGYYVNPNFTCTNCDLPMSHCIDCLVSDLCLDCSFGYYVNVSQCQLCSLKMSQCVDCQNSTVCVQCTSDFIPVNGTCVCRVGFEVNSICNIILGCVSNHYISGVKRCLACNANKNFTYSNFNCSCKLGYSIVGKWQNAVCKQICGDGRLIYLACDDGNLLNGDGCSSTCYIESGYQCQNGTFWTPSICGLVTNFKVQLYSIKRDDDQNSGVVRLSFDPVYPKLGVIQWGKFINFSIYNTKSSPSTGSIKNSKLGNSRLMIGNVNNHNTNTAKIASTKVVSASPLNIKTTGFTYNEGIVSIQFDYFQNVENFDAHIDLVFDKSFFRSPSASFSFPMKSMNIPLTYQTYLNHHQVLIILFYVIVGLGLLQFLICFKTKNMVGKETLQILQFIFFVKLLTDDINPSLLYMNYPLFYANGFNFILSNQGRNYNMQMGMARLNIQPQFVLNLNLSVLILLILFLIKLYFIFTGIKDEKNDPTKLKIQQVKEQKQNLNNIDQNFILPVCMISIFLVTFSLASKYSIRNYFQTQVPRWLESLTALTAIFAFFYVYFRQMKVLFDMPFNFSQSQQISLEKDYNQNYIAFNVMFYLSCAVTIISCRNQNYGFYVLGSLCLIYLIILLVQRPYSTKIDNFGIIFNQIVIIYSLGILVYINFFQQSLSIILLCMYGTVALLFFSIILGYFRIYYTYKYRQNFSERKCRLKQAKTIQQAILEKKLKKKLGQQNSYLYENQLKVEEQRKNNSKQKLLKKKYQPGINSTQKQKQKKHDQNSTNEKTELQKVKQKLKLSLKNRRINDSKRLIHRGEYQKI